MIEDIRAARAEGARLAPACEVAGNQLADLSALDARR